MKIIIILLHAFIAWFLSGSLFMLNSITTMENVIIIHAIAAPIIFGITSWTYFKKFNYTTPLKTAVIFTLFVIAIIFFIIAPFAEGFEMFNNILGTWIPFALIFISTYLVGSYINK